MEEIVLEVQPRGELGKSKVKDLREKGFIPAVIYAEGKKSQPIKVSHRQLWQLIHQHRLESTVINLKIQDDKEQKGRPCLIKEIQHDPVKGDIIHVDFNEISLTKVIKVNVPVVAKGEPVGVRQEGGSLEHTLWEIEVECLPTDIPKDIEVDVSQLKIGDDIHIKDITFPSNIKVLNNPEAIVFSVTAPIKEEVVVPAVEGEEKQEPEVIKEKKEVPAEGAEEEKSEKEKK
ncbi:MAG: 50S ribosomal protein L25 [Candidatus Omnitrophica bacterium CG23_combo_of_CG06-09_8_20_14_all_40_11]|nr:MAG: 50S ribosomal protein L25 [Candidatus Omnitrophica bacterium CG23_combo_of_CG06-09_8_20_14_all_40_11]